MTKQSTSLNRRKFLATSLKASVAIGAPMIVPASALGRGALPPSERIAMGAIGIGNRGTYDLKTFLKNDKSYFRAVCDVQQKHRLRAKQLIDSTNENTDCEMHTDLRELLDRSDIDAVLIATGPNWHALAATLAGRAGKDVYCEKPNSKNIAEGAELADVFRRTGQVFQAGTQRRSVANFAFACELAKSGRLGKLHTVHSDVHRTGMNNNTSGWATEQTVPDRAVTDWDQYLGPSAWRPYNKKHMDGFHFQKGGEVVGNGFLEWGAHCVDLCQWANDSDFTAPVEYKMNREKKGFEQMEGIYDNGVKLVLRSHSWMPLGRCRVRFEGSDGWVETGDSGQVIVSSPELRGGQDPPSGNGLSIVEHVEDFLQSVKSRTPAICNAEVANYSHMACHAAGIALLLDRPLKFDPTTQSFPEDEQANRLVSEARREPWAI